jgi:hypothetical protein
MGTNAALNLSGIRPVIDSTSNVPHWLTASALEWNIRIDTAPFDGGGHLRPAFLRMLLPFVRGADDESAYGTESCEYA